MVLNEAHVSVAEWHYTGKSIVRNILQDGLWWPTLHANARDYCHSSDICQRIGKSS